ncbi:6226_t:CDS:2, partial [Scutellospora calospora]
KLEENLINLLWNVNLHLEKGILEHVRMDQFEMQPGYVITSTIQCSLIDNDSVHNYSMDSDIKNNTPRYQRLTEEMINKVELYHQCNIQPIKIIHLLENEYPDYYIKPRTAQSKLGEQQYNQFMNDFYTARNALQERVQSISKTLFPEIVTLCEKYLTPHVLAEIKQQIDVSRDNIQEIWHIVRLVGLAHFEQLNQFRKISEVKISTKKFLQDCIHYGKSYGLLQTALKLAIDTGTNEELNQWYYQFIQQKKELQKANSKVSEDYNSQENAVQVTNLKVISTKGHPSKRQKSALESRAK